MIGLICSASPSALPTTERAGGQTTGLQSKKEEGENHSSLPYPDQLKKVKWGGGGI